jgi:hypothetical protein
MAVELSAPPTVVSARTEGWGRPLRATKAHYFVDNVSLCNRWEFYGGGLEDGRTLATDCKTCARALEQRGAIPASATHPATVH